jgi:hypothetical protein
VGPGRQSRSGVLDAPIRFFEGAAAHIVSETNLLTHPALATRSGVTSVASIANVDRYGERDNTIFEHLDELRLSQVRLVRTPHTLGRELLPFAIARSSTLLSLRWAKLVL